MDGIRALKGNDGIAEVEYNCSVIIDVRSIVGTIAVAIEHSQCEKISIGLEGAGIVRAKRQAFRPETNPHYNIQIRFNHSHSSIPYSSCCLLACSLPHLSNIIYPVPDYIYRKMNRQYESIFRTKKLNHHQLKSKILAQYPNIIPHQKYNYDEFLYILDQQIHQRCDRDVLHQLYTQACNNRSQASLDDLVGKYIQNLQTSKVCILRDQYQLKQLLQQYQSSRNRSKSFIFFKMIQASIYTRFTKEPTFQYKIQPTDLPPVTLVNSLNPVLNHQYTLEMEENQFDIIFYESGIEILRWTFPDRIGLEEGEYTRVVKSENVTFQAKIKYMPKDQNKAKAGIKDQMSEVEQHLEQEKLAFHRLCVFKPFLQRSHLPAKEEEANRGAWHTFTESLFDLFPFLRQHVKTLFYLLIITILLECWTSFYWAMQFLDIITCFYALSFLLDPTVQEYSLKIMILQLTFLLLCIKSIWGAVEMPFFTNSGSNKVLIVVCIILKIIVILALSISLIRKEEIHHQKTELLSEPKQPQAAQSNRLQDNIWQD